jgi:transcriptional regulator with XRE-family HTH domain
MLAMSQQQLAEALGITYQQVQKCEKGANRIGASRLQQISHILQVPVAYCEKIKTPPRKVYLGEAQLWRGQAPSEERACPLPQLQAFWICNCRPSNLPRFRLGCCDRCHKLLFE